MDRNRLRKEDLGFSEYESLIGAAGVRTASGLSGSAILPILGVDGLSLDLHLNMVTGQGGGKEGRGGRGKKAYLERYREIYLGPRCVHEDGG